MARPCAAADWATKKAGETMTSLDRRSLLFASAAVGALGAARTARAAKWEPHLGYPDPRVKILDPSGASLRQGLAKLEQLATGFHFTEGPVWFGNHRCLIFSDLPGNRLIRWDEASGNVSVFRDPSNHANGNCKDREGRLLSCEQMNRRVVRQEHDGSITVIADRFDGKPLNSPNDIVVKSDGSIWFTDPPNGITNDYEGRRARQELPTNVYRVDPTSGAIAVALGDVRPNGLCFSHDERKLYVTHNIAAENIRTIRVYDVADDGARLTNGKVFISHASSTADGIKCDWQGNVWASWGAGEGESGVRVFSPEGKPLMQIELPERAANLYFGGPVGNRLFMTAQQSLYSLYVGTRGAKLI
jgi:gluconolactonase